MYYTIHAYFKFLLNSTNQHGVHSPFVFDLVTRCLYDKTYYTDYDMLKSYRGFLKSQTETINVTDLGAGSRVFKSNQRKISRILKHSGATLKEAKFLNRLTRYIGANSILELGTSLGMSTLAFSLGAHKGKVTSIEGCPNIFAYTRAQFNRLQRPNVSFINSDFGSVLSDLSDQQFDLIYFDGNHKKQATMDYFETLLPTIHNNTVWVFDDMYWSREMSEAWHYIQLHPKVTVTVDMFNLGLVFFRKEQAKEHFKIRY